MQLRSWAFALILGLTSTANAAEDQSVEGVVSNVNIERQTITVRNERNGRRSTYFVAADARLSSGGQALTLREIKRGNVVTLRYRATDEGREIITARVPDPGDIIDVTPIEVTAEQTISGRVTGVRPSKRTITIRDDATRQRRTLKIPEETRISRAGSPVRLNNIKRGDDITARYRVTDRGLILVTGRSPVPAPVASVASVPTQQLPKTAGHVFAYLLLGLGLITSAGVARVIRKARA